MLTTVSLLYSYPLHAVDWIYFSSSAGRNFLHHCDVVHKFSEDVIVQRRKEILSKVWAIISSFQLVISHVILTVGLTAEKKELRLLGYSPFSKG